MRETFIATFLFLCLVAASLASMLSYLKVPIQNRQNDTVEVVRMVASMFVVVTSLVLGLMINAAKNSFQEIDDHVHAYATELILLDRSLRKLGPEAIDARQPLVAYVQAMVDRRTPSESSVPDNRLAERLIDEIGAGLRQLKPVDADQGELRQEARERLQKVVELRWTLLGEAQNTIPRPLIRMLGAWLVLVFALMGFRAPRNGVVIGTFVVAAALLAGSIYLILDMDSAFDGRIQVSTAPLERALAEMKV